MIQYKPADSHTNKVNFLRNILLFSIFVITTSITFTVNNCEPGGWTAPFTAGLALAGGIVFNYMAKPEMSRLQEQFIDES